MINNIRTTVDLNAFYWYQIFALDFVVVKTEKNDKLAWMLPNYCNVTSQRNNLIKLKHYEEKSRKKKAPKSVLLMTTCRLKHRNNCGS